MAVELHIILLRREYCRLNRSRNALRRHRGTTKTRETAPVATRRFGSSDSPPQIHLLSLVQYIYNGHSLISHQRFYSKICPNCPVSCGDRGPKVVSDKRFKAKKKVNVLYL